MATVAEQAESYLRQDFATIFAVPMSRLQLQTPLDELAPRSDRRRLWREAEQKLGLRLPMLQLSREARRFGFWTVVATAVRVALAALLLGAPWAAVPLALVALIATAWLFYELSRPWAVDHPELQTYGDLIRLIAEQNAGKLRRRLGIKFSREEIFAIVKRILVDALGVRPEEVTWDARLSDLGCS